MTSYTAVAEVSDALVELIRNRIDERPDVVNLDRREVALVSPSDVGSDSDVRLSLYLYRVTENTAMRNASRRPVGEDRMQNPPLALDLNYLLTAHPSGSGSDQTANTIDQHRVLGLGMQILHDHSGLDEDAFPPHVAEADTQVSLKQLSPDAMMNLWSSLQDTSMHPSATYEISPVLIDSEVREEVPRIRERRPGVERRPDPE